MEKVKYILTGILFAMLVAGCGNTMTEPQPAPEGMVQSGTFVIRANELIRLSGGISGRGTLVFQGWEHPFTFSDAKIGVTGDNPEVHGTVYNLENLEDIEGTYTPIEAELDEGKGLVGAWSKNDMGVVIHMHFDAEHVSVNLKAKGATVTLIKQ